MKLADTKAAELAGVAWLGGKGIRGALDDVFPGLTLEELGEWAHPGMTAVRGAAFDSERFEARFVGAIAAAMILGAKLKETGER